MKKDRKKLYAARRCVMPFLAFAKTFLAMSDGWIMHETRKQVLGWNDDPGAKDWDFFTFKMGKLWGVSAYERMRATPNDEELHLYLTCLMPELVDNVRGVMVSRVVESTPKSTAPYYIPHRDYRVPFDLVKKEVYYWVNIHGDVWER